MADAWTPNCEHEYRRGCIYCPICGTPYQPPEPEPPGFLHCFTAPFEAVANFFSGLFASPGLDVTANHQAIRNGEPEEVRTALRFLLRLAPMARRIRPDIEALLEHEDRDIALRARDVLKAMGPG